jgi:hypothetical protein
MEDSNRSSTEPANRDPLVMSLALVGIVRIYQDSHSPYYEVFLGFLCYC